MGSVAGAYMSTLDMHPDPYQIGFQYCMTPVKIESSYGRSKETLLEPSSKILTYSFVMCRSYCLINYISALTTGAEPTTNNKPRG